MKRHATLAAGLCLAGISSASADESSGTNQPPSFWQRDSLTGDWGGGRTRLMLRGIDFAPVYIGEVFGNLAGGAVGPGAVYDQCVTLPLTVDLEKLAGWKSATFHAHAYWIAGQSLTEQCVGDVANVSNISADPALRLQDLWLKQSLWQETFSVKAGLIAADNDFFLADSSAMFVNATFGAFPLVGANLPNPPIFPMAAPAVWLQVQPVPSLYFQAAIFNGDSGTQDGNSSGTDFPLSADDGALIFSEIGFLPPPDGDADLLATTLKAGAFVHTRRVPDWNAQAGGATGGGQINFGVYAVGEQDLFRRDQRQLTAFVRGGYAPADRNVVDWYFDAGLNFAGFMPGRPQDSAGVAVGRSNFSREYSRYEQTVNGSASLDHELVVEATYQFNLAPWWTVQPDFQYIFQPGGCGSTKDAFVLGLRTRIVF